ncbi:MAG TPA: hypothetical protein VFZ43_04950 [Anaerolineales bacterium]
MADLRCPNCGKENPDSLDRCQFCQSLLKPESMLQTGESPTKRDTGELEPILPDWLRDLRQQAKKSAEEDAAQEAARPKVEKNEPPDLLAGLASQAGGDDDEVPDWLASINPSARAKPSESPAREADPLATQHDKPSLIGEPHQDQSEVQDDKDELSEWFSQASEQPGQPFILEPDISQDDPDWISNLASSAESPGEASQPKDEEDLSWLRDLEASAKQPAEPSTPQEDLGGVTDNVSSPSSSREEDLNWLNSLSGISEPSQPFDAFGSTTTQDKPASAEPSAPQEDLSWLDNLGSTSELSQPETQKPSGQEALDWLNDRGKTGEPLRPTQPPAAQENLEWLNTLGGPSGHSEAEFTQPSTHEDLSRLTDKEETSKVSDSSSSAFSPRQTAPLSEEAESESEPDWLKSAAEEPSMPPLGAKALDWFASHDRDTDQPDAAQESSVEESPDFREETPSHLFEPETSDFTPSSETPPASNQDVDSLFSIDMPDWLSQPESGASEASLQEVEIPSTEGSESLTPVELPSWVQAMRPVEAVISETGPGSEQQAPEREGPLAGLGGIIPLLPIGSSRKPKALSLTLQATDEQQAGAALLEEILAAETNPRSPVTASSFASQNVLRWVLTGLVIVVLGAMIGLGSQSMPVSTVLPAEVSALSNAMANIPEAAPVLVALDYEPALAGEMEAISGPLLNNLVVMRHPNLSFLSASPNGPALVERLMNNTGISRLAPAGQGYQVGEQYFNLGYLPGGPAGVLAFIQSPETALPAAGVGNFSDYAAVIVLTDHAESGRVWVEQLDARRQTNPTLANQPLLMVASAQAGPLLQPYVSSRQVAGMISGLPDAARYEVANNVPPGTARIYWDTFGIGLLLAIILITFGSLWNLFMTLRPHRAGAE